MDAFFTCGFWVLGLFALIAAGVLFDQRNRLRLLRKTVQNLAQRVATLEARGPVSPATPPVAGPPPLPVVAPVPAVTPPVQAAPGRPARVSIDWEAFLGVKLFAWLGGFVLFLAVVFLVNYAFENNLITPVLRVALGALLGLALVAGGWFTALRNYRAPGQSLCATGVLVLYADVFAAHAFYGMIPLALTFLLMSAITLAAFLLAVLLEAQVVAVLGLLGGFLTPFLLRGGQDQAALLFGYVALLNFGIAALVLRKRWDYLLLLAALGTAGTELAWMPIGDAAEAALGFFIFLGLQAQFVLLAWMRQRQMPAEKWSTPAALVTGGAALGFGFWLLFYPSLAARPGFFFSFIFLADIGLLALALLRPNPGRIATGTGAAVFFILGAWTASILRVELQWWALASYLLYGIIHAGFTVWPRPVGIDLKVPVWLGRMLGMQPGEGGRRVPTFAAALPLVLLGMFIARLPVTDPTAVFATALLLAVVLLAFGIAARSSWIAVVALAFTWAVEREWHSLHFLPGAGLLALGWYLAFGLVFAAYPYFARDQTRALPWAVGALGGVLHFWLIYELAGTSYPFLQTGLLPALFILPYAFGVYFLRKRLGAVPAAGDVRLAWQGGTALFFLSLIFPIQFEREWITLGWAMEGLALLVLFRFVPHVGLRWVGAALLSFAFLRLAVNPAVLEYHGRSAMRIWNWYLYAYGITALCLFGGARAVQSFGATKSGRVIPRLLYTLGAVLTFLLLNIEIADYFSVGPTLTFSFEGNFARDMTYSIAWALFAIVLLLVGMRQKTKGVRYAGMLLLLTTLAKLFLHDFANLGPLYRIGAFLGVAVVLILASFAYQRFLAPPPRSAL